MEPTAIVTIAAAAVKLLSSFFLELAKGAGSETGKTAASGAVTKTRELYATVKAKFSGKPAAEEALTNMENTPDDADIQAALRVQLKQALEVDPGFASQLAQLLKGAEDAGVSTVFKTNITGDVEKLIQIGVVHGDVSI